MDTREHWDSVYRTRPTDSVSWYQASPAPSLRLLDNLNISDAASLIDVGGGASTLVDALLARGWRDLTVLDISETAISAARERLGGQAAGVSWLVADITSWKPERSFEVWHDRAVFHFLTEAGDRDAYLHALREAVSPNGFVIIATFALDGPEKCSGLPVRRYDHETLTLELGEGFSLIAHFREVHETPAGTAQSFTWCAFTRK